MKQLRSKTPDFHKEIEIQPIIYVECQPVITEEIQPIIIEKIRPVIFNENQTNIEEVIQQLELSHKRIYKIKREVPETKRLVKKTEQIVYIPYIMKEEKHSTKKEIEEKTEREIKTLEKIEFVPYILYKNGEIHPYEKEKKEKKSKEFIPNTQKEKVFIIITITLEKISKIKAIIIIKKHSLVVIISFIETLLKKDIQYY